jgi:hypothetical protein
MSRRLLVVAAAAVLPALAGCEAGNSAPTLQWHYPTQGAGTVLGKISIRNVFILGAPLGKHLGQGQSASLFFALVNTGRADRLLKVEAAGAATSVTLPSSTIELGATPVFLQGPAPQAYLKGLKRPLISGQWVYVKFIFKNSGSVRLQVPIIAQNQFFSSYSPAPSASPTTPLSPTTSASPHRKHGHKRRHASSPSPTPSTSS